MGKDSKIEWTHHPGWARVHYDQLKNDTEFVRYGKAAAGRLLDGRTWDEFPA